MKILRKIHKDSKNYEFFSTSMLHFCILYSCSYIAIFTCILSLFLLKNFGLCSLCNILLNLYNLISLVSLINSITTYIFYNQPISSIFQVYIYLLYISSTFSIFLLPSSITYLLCHTLYHLSSVSPVFLPVTLFSVHSHFLGADKLHVPQTCDTFFAYLQIIAFMRAKLGDNQNKLCNFCMNKEKYSREVKL